ncbi:type II toxin-antitoxin system RelE/ParE family toxin [Mesorhizobium calcicola]|uniref:Type II toxin-antitoxin system RelE/ParE family toxin n=1 Tax=Mesorhizobium calcicola TaxID=1300310 RepID=A0ABW4WQG9_9HYPH
MNYTVKFHPAAEQDLDELLTHLAQETGATVANRFVDRIVDYCLGFSTFPERGMHHDNLAKGLRTVDWRRRATIAFTVREDSVTVLRILYAGRTLELPTDDE